VRRGLLIVLVWLGLCSCAPFCRHVRDRWVRATIPAWAEGLGLRYRLAAARTPAIHPGWMERLLVDVRSPSSAAKGWIVERATLRITRAGRPPRDQMRAAFGAEFPRAGFQIASRELLRTPWW